LESLKEKEKEHSSFVEEIKNQQILIDQNSDNDQLITEEFSLIKDDLNLEELDTREENLY
jgi:4-hydroxyphenylpyruvate dioxygenase-like putative hemolysin